MTGNIELKQAPCDFVPNCETIHEETTAIMRQTWPGTNVCFILNKKTGECEARVDNRVVGHWKDATVGMWGDIAYTLETEFSDRITNTNN